RYNLSATHDNPAAGNILLKRQNSRALKTVLIFLAHGRRSVLVWHDNTQSMKPDGEAVSRQKPLISQRFNYGEIRQGEQLVTNRIGMSGFLDIAPGFEEPIELAAPSHHSSFK